MHYQGSTKSFSISTTGEDLLQQSFEFKAGTVSTVKWRAEACVTIQESSLWGTINRDMSLFRKSRYNKLLVLDNWNKFKSFIYISLFLTQPHQ